MRKYSYLTNFLFLITFIVTGNSVNAQSSLQDEMRMPWAVSQKDFFREWLMVGGFSNSDGKGLDTDFLEENGGETKISPVQGMIQTLPDSSTVEWKNYKSPYNYVNFIDVLKGTDFNVKVAYAYKKIQRPQAGKVIVSFGFTGGHKLWVNGKLIYQQDDGGANAENNQVEVDMVKGENSILVKSTHTWSWGFWMRSIEPGNYSLVYDSELAPSIIESEEKDKLVIRTDRTLSPGLRKLDVTVKVVAAGGKVISEKKVNRFAEVAFNTSDWKDGAYDICLTGINNKGELVTKYLYWYKGDPIKAAKELVADAPEIPESSDELIHAMLAEMIYDRVGSDLSNVDSSSIEKLYSPLMEYEELVNNSSVRANGFVRLAYKDEVDNTPQFCRAYLPMEYDPNKKWPLVVNLHGYNGENPVYVKWWSVDSRHYDMVDKYPVIEIEPHGRGNTGYRGIGEKDVLRCIEMAKEKFNVDETRIYLKGESMGGGGTWLVGTKHPELFAAIAPVFGGWDYHRYLSEEDLAELSDDERFEYEVTSSFAQADALLTTPVLVTHGDIDEAVDVKYSRYVVRMLQRWGYDIRYHEYPGFGHEGIRFLDEMLPWFLKHTKNAEPRKVRVRSAYLSSAKAHWVKVVQRDNPFSFIEAEAEVLINNTIRLATENVLSVELTPPSALIDPNEKVTVVWNVDDIREVKLNDGKITLSDKNYKPDGLNKNPDIEGPISHLTTTPFAVVIGTSSKDTLMNKLCRMKADEFISYWKNWQKFEPRVFLDTELSEDEMKEYSLMLYGDAEANLITRKLGDRIPLNISSDIIEIAGKSFEAKNACVQMIYPHPLNSNRYLTVIGATSPEGMFFYNRESSNFDFFIRDGCIQNSKLGFTDDKISVARGIFDHSWQINGEFLRTGNKEVREKCFYKKVLPDLTTTVDNLPEIDLQAMEALTGKYEANPGVIVEVYLDSGALIAKSPGGDTFRLYPASATEYFTDKEDIQFTFNKNDNGIVEDAVGCLNGNDVPLTKIE